MPAGKELDTLVHEQLFGQEKGRIPPYSTDIEHAINIVTLMPISVGQMHPSDSRYKAGRPYWAGDENLLMVVTASPALALCKAALLIKFDAIANLKKSLKRETADVPKED